MTSIDQTSTFTLGTRAVRRIGYCAMQLAGSGVFGPSKDRAAALALLRGAVGSGVTRCGCTPIESLLQKPDHWSRHARRPSPQVSAQVRAEAFVR